MKLSEVKGERAFEVLEGLVDLIQPVANDPDAAALFTDRKKPKGMSNTEFGFRWLNDAIAKLMVRHRKDFVKIVALIDGVTEQEYLENSDIGKMTDDVMGLFTDSVFSTLFFSAAQRTGKHSGSAAETTTGEES